MADERTPLLFGKFKRKRHRQRPMFSPVDEGSSGTLVESGDQPSVTVVDVNGPEKDDKAPLIESTDTKITASVNSISNGVASGNANDDNSAEDDETVTRPMDPSLRGCFLGKVYLAFVPQMMLAAGLISLFAYVPHLRKLLREGLVAYLVASTGTAFILAILVIWFCSPWKRKRGFLSYILFTVCVSYNVGAFCPSKSAEGILIACGICAICSIVVALISFIPKVDVSSYYGVLIIPVCSSGLFTLMYFCTSWTLTETVVASVCSTLLMMFLWFGTRLLVRHNRHKIKPNEVWFGALESYFEVGMLLWRQCKGQCF